MRAGNLYLRLALLAAAGLALGAIGWRGARALWLASLLDDARAALAERDFRRADDALARALAAAPADPAALLLAAQSARRQGRLDEAGRRLEAYKKAGGPDDDEAARERRLSRLQSGNVADVERVYARAAPRPDDPESALALEAVVEGVLKYLEPTTDVWGRLDEKRNEIALHKLARQAAEVYSAGRDSPAQRTLALVWRGRLAFALHDLPTASRSLREALDRDADLFDARFYLALSVVQRSPKEAAGHFQRLHEARPADLRVRFALATARRGLGEFDESRRLLDALSADGHGHAAVLLERGRLEIDAERPADAEGWLRKAAAQAPDDPEAAFSLAACLQLQGKADEAAATRQRAEKLREAKER